MIFFLCDQQHSRDNFFYLILLTPNQVGFQFSPVLNGRIIGKELGLNLCPLNPLQQPLQSLDHCSSDTIRMIYVPTILSLSANKHLPLISSNLKGVCFAFAEKCKFVKMTFDDELLPLGRSSGFEQKFVEGRPWKLLLPLASMLHRDRVKSRPPTGSCKVLISVSF